MCRSIWRYEIGRDGWERVVGAGRGAKAEEEPRALQVRQLGKLAEQRIFGFESFGAPGTDVLWRADGGAECDKASLLGGPVATPHVGPEVGDPGRRRATCVVEDARVFPKLADMSVCVSTVPVTRSKAARARVGLGNRTWRSSRRAMSASPSRNCESARRNALCWPSANKAGARGSPCSHPSAWGMPWRTCCIIFFSHAFFRPPK